MLSMTTHLCMLRGKLSIIRNIDDSDIQGVCQVGEKSGNSLYPFKSQGKVREFSEKSGNFSEIKKSFFRNSKLRKKYQNYTFQKFRILRGEIPVKKFIKC